MCDKSRQFCFDRVSRTSTSSDSSSEPDDDFFNRKTNPLKHKTQLCKIYSELGYCNYGYKCRFAHSKLELVVLPVSQAFRKKKCKGYWEKGCCPYGLRCQFGHANLDWQDSACLAGLFARGSQEEEIPRRSRLMKVLK